ncbi:hypothetical protein LCGC14_1978570 [marine sediment metagenome]|uniref:Uncharacterized protein n=1 Tax=marine sediment metagenome TaxID=412755 RepID=A0A0F9FXT5_9ZZZZ
MLIDAITQTLEIKLSGAVSANELPVVLAYIDGEASNFFPTLQHSISNGTTEVTILAAPEPRGKRMVKFMYIRNTDTATVTLILQLADGATDREIVKISLLQDETLVYTDTTGFKVIDTNGNTKVGGGGGFAAPTGGIDIGDSATEGSLATHSKSDHQHAFAAPSGGYPLDVAAAEADGSATTPARSDHVHKNMDIGARAFDNANQTISDNTATAIDLNSERYDTDTIHDLSTNNSRLTATTAGKYVITANIEFASNSTGRRLITIRLNGSTFIAEMEWDANQNDTTRMALTTIYELAATNYVEIVVLQTSTGNLDVVANANFSPEFAMQKMG